MEKSAGKNEDVRMLVYLQGFFFIFFFFLHLNVTYRLIFGLNIENVRILNV